MFSPNGRWLAYVSNESGRDEVYVRPYPDRGTRIPISTNGGIEPVWSRDGRELYYRDEQQMMVVSIDDGAMLVPETPRVLFTVSREFVWAGYGNPNYDVSPEGRFLMVRTETGDTTSQRLRVVLNFFEELKAKVGN
jgi:serine/threonine-protein kinase